MDVLAHKVGRLGWAGRNSTCSHLHVVSSGLFQFKRLKQAKSCISSVNGGKKNYTECGSGIHSIDNIINVDFSGKVSSTNVQLFTDDSKTEEHVGAEVAAIQKSLEIYTETQRLGNECTVFQAELIGIKMAIDCIISQRKDKTSYGIHIDSQAALHAVANKRMTQPIAVYIRKKMIDLKNTTEISLIRNKHHSGIKGNERAEYLAKTAARYRNTIQYNSIPLPLSKRLIQNYYININII
ncbi:hypothetical protein ANN_00747 [Periplaneta americana]|uniref:RNase H type-1 domain-containing protein n=1 Tax=Periplaneta americana TaxID=6978 RepID=A0ABQ8TRN2_PERAM|nr:hypothetical protein ANN_00747 [Periplaneta americana]